MNDTPIEIVLIEDNPGDARLIEHMLKMAQGLAFRLVCLENLTDGIAHLKTHRTDVLLLDLGLPESAGLATVQKVMDQVPDMPTLVVLSGLSDESVAVQAVQSGAQDYLVKGQVDTAQLVRSIRYAIERSQAKEALRKANDELEQRVVARTAELANTVAALHAEILERKQAEERIRYMAHYDALTGLPNRDLLQDRIRQALAFAHRNRAMMAVLFIDLDYFKHINVSLGHKVGDRLLQLAAGRLQACLREGDSLSRPGGDEFVLFLPLLNSVSAAAVVAQKVLDSFAAPFEAEGHELHASASVGVSLYPDDGGDVEALMQAAYTAMNHAKQMGRGSYQFFTPSLNKTARQRMALEGRMRQALSRNELVLYYQPQVHMADGAIFSCEALLRWRQPGKEAMSCGGLIGIAEETSLILSIGDWVLHEACRKLKQWVDAGHTDLHMAVNLSPRQVCQPHFFETVTAILDETGLPPTVLDLEITEGMLLEHSDEVIGTLQRLNALGIHLSLDDFGTGYSSLSYLQRFPVHSLKIDQSFVRNIGRDRNATALVSAIIAMANSLDMEVLAEGVETPQQAAFLLKHGCPSAQGYYYSEAVPDEAFIRLLEQARPGPQVSH
jgi:diguanylate cyclase (GGDEF)-like protein